MRARACLRANVCTCVLNDQDVKHEIKRDPRGNTTVTDLTTENVDPNDGAGVDEIMQVSSYYFILRI